MKSKKYENLSNIPIKTNKSKDQTNPKNNKNQSKVPLRSRNFLNIPKDSKIIPV